MARVLVVDDERQFAETLAERLRTRGMEVHTAYDGASAVEAVRQTHPDVVLLDLSMPGMDGLAALKAIKELVPRTEVVLLTAESGLAAAVGGMKRGAADYIVKPAPLERILKAIQEAEAHRLDAAQRQRMAETARLAALGELAVGVAHEINNPLQIVLNEAGWMAETLAETPMEQSARRELEESLATIREQTARCKAVTTKLLSLRAAVPADDTPQPLARLIAQLLEDRRSRWQGRFFVEHTCPPSLMVSAETWRHILAPLVDNALDALEAQGAATPEATQAQLRLCIHASQAPQEIVVQVQDTGIGMEPAVLARIFEPFFSTKEVGKGMGLGLSLCHALVEALGGRIEIASTPHHGTTVSVTIPYTAITAPTAGLATAKEDSHEYHATAHRGR